MICGVIYTNAAVHYRYSLLLLVPRSFSIKMSHRTELFCIVIHLTNLIKLHEWLYLTNIIGHGPTPLLMDNFRSGRFNSAVPCCRLWPDRIYIILYLYNTTTIHIVLNGRRVVCFRTRWWQWVCNSVWRLSSDRLVLLLLLLVARVEANDLLQEQRKWISYQILIIVGGENGNHPEAILSWENEFKISGWKDEAVVRRFGRLVRREQSHQVSEPQAWRKKNLFIKYFLRIMENYLVAGCVGACAEGFFRRLVCTCTISISMYTYGNEIWCDKSFVFFVLLSVKLDMCLCSPDLDKGIATATFHRTPRLHQRHFNPVCHSCSAISYT